MEIVSTTEVTQTLTSIISKVQKEPVVIQENDCEIAVIMSIEDYKRLTESNIQEFHVFRKKLANKAQERGLREDKLNEQFIDTLNEDKTTEINRKIDRQTFLKLPIEERNRILAQQVAAIEEYYKTDSEWQDWVNIN